MSPADERECVRKEEILIAWLLGRARGSIHLSNRFMMYSLIQAPQPFAFEDQYAARKLNR